MDFLIFFGLFLVIIVVGVGLVAKRGLEFKKLAQEGQAGRAQIVEKKKVRRKGSDAPTLTYEFQDILGQTQRKRIHVPESIYAQHEAGGTIEIVYLSDRPQVNGPKYLVDKVRQV